MHYIATNQLLTQPPYKSKKMTPFDRLEHIAKEEKRSLRKIVELTGRNPSIVSALRNGKKSVSDDLAEAIGLAFGYNSEWIMKGAGDMKSLKGPADPKAGAKSNADIRSVAEPDYSYNTLSVAERVRLETENRMLREHVDLLTRLLNSKPESH